MRRSEKNVSEQKAAIERNGEATLLVVDDEPEIVALLDEYFTGLGYRVLTAEDGATALKRAEQSPDLIVLDVGMPLMDGYAVCRRLREHLTCPILFLAAHGLNEHAAAVLIDIHGARGNERPVVRIVEVEPRDFVRVCDHPVLQPAEHPGRHRGHR